MAWCRVRGSGTCRSTSRFKAQDRRWYSSPGSALRFGCSGRSSVNSRSAFAYLRSILEAPDAAPRLRGHRDPIGRQRRRSHPVEASRGAVSDRHSGRGGGRVSLPRDAMVGSKRIESAGTRRPHGRAGDREGKGMSERRYRVAQWATGNIGLRSLRAVLDHPQYDLVGVYVYSDRKAGKDAGELCGTEPTGVTATRSIDEIIRAKPDCVLYMPDRTEVDNLCRLLGAGINVVATRMDLHNPETLDPGVRARIESACQEGGASLYSTGASPGFITEALPSPSCRSSAGSTATRSMSTPTCRRATRRR